MIQGILWQDLLLHIARLTDPPEQGRHSNLTLLRLPHAVPDEPLRGEIQSLTELACRNAHFARERRNKYLAHQDLSLALTHARELPVEGGQNVETVLDIFRQVLNKVSVAYLENEMLFDFFVSSHDADDLIRHLSVAMKCEEQRQERLRQGRPLPEDFEPL